MKNEIPTHAVKAVITNSDEQLLFLQRNPRNGGIANWDLPGGLVEVGETDRLALTRELLEELDVKASVGKMLGEWSFFRPYDEKTVSVTNYAVMLENQDIKLSEEHIACRWYSKTELPSLAVKDVSIFSALGFLVPEIKSARKDQT